MNIKKKENLAVKKHKLLLEENRRLYNSTCEKFSGMRNRILTFLAIELAVLTYFFTDLRSIIPSELYGIVFFVVGVACLLFSVTLFFYCYRSIHNWPTPIGPVEVEKLKHAHSESEVLSIFVKDYAEANIIAGKIFSRYAKFSNWGLYLFIVGVIILLVIKFF